MAGKLRPGQVLASGFGGFGSAESLAFFNLKPEIQQIFKKLTKKDPLTRRKGLEELKKLLDELDASDEEVVLQKWCQEFVKLVEDTDYRIREHTLRIMELFAKKVGKNLAPHLKTVMASWLIAKFDPRNEVVSAANNSLRAAIPEAKHAGSLIFCKKEIIEALQERFLYTPESVLDKSMDSNLEAIEKYERVVSASLAVLDHMMTIIPIEEATKIQSNLEDVFDDKFWSFLATKHVPIRRAAYAFVRILATKLKFIVEKRLNQLADVVFATLGDKEPATHASMWDSVIVFIKEYPATVELPSFKKSFVPKLITFFNNGAYGSGQASYSSLLPLLSILPESVVFGADFYNKLLQSIWKGLKSEHIDAGSNPWVVEAYIECITFYSIRASRLGKIDVALEVMKEHFYPIIEAFFKYEQIISPSLAPASAQLILRLCSRPECAIVSQEFWARFREATSKFVLLTPDGSQPDAAWKPISLEKDQAKQLRQNEISGEHLGLFLVELLKTEPSVTLRKSGTFVEVPDQVKNYVRELYNSASVIIASIYLPQLEILGSLSKTYFTWDLSDAIETIEIDILPRVPTKSEEFVDPKTSRASRIIIDMLSSFFAVSSLSPTGRRTWEALLGLWAKETNLIAIKHILEACSANGAFPVSWRHPLLDELALKVSSNIEDDENSKFLFFVLSGKSQSTSEAYIDDDTLAKVATTFLTKIDELKNAKRDLHSIALVGEAILHTDVTSSIKLQVLQRLLNIKLTVSDRSEELNSALSGAIHDSPALFLNVNEADMFEYVITPTAETVRASVRISSVPIHDVAVIVKALASLSQSASHSKIASLVLPSAHDLYSTLTDALDAFASGDNVVELDTLALKHTYTSYGNSTKAVMIPHAMTSLGNFARTCHALVEICTSLGSDVTFAVRPDVAYYLSGSSHLLAAELAVSGSSTPLHNVWNASYTAVKSVLSKLLSSATNDTKNALVFTAVELFKSELSTKEAKPRLFDIGALHTVVKTTTQNDAERTMYIVTNVLLPALQDGNAAPSFSATILPLLKLYSEPTISKDIKSRVLNKLYGAATADETTLAVALENAAVTFSGGDFDDGHQRKILESFPSIAKAIIGKDSVSPYLAASFMRFCHDVLVEQCDGRLTADNHWSGLASIVQRFMSSTDNQVMNHAVCLLRSICSSEQYPKGLLDGLLSSFSQAAERFIDLISSKQNSAQFTLTRNLATLLRRIPIESVTGLVKENLLYPILNSSNLDAQFTAYTLLRPFVAARVKLMSGAASSHKHQHKNVSGRVGDNEDYHVDADGEDEKETTILHDGLKQIISNFDTYHASTDVLTDVIFHGKVGLLLAWHLVLDCIDSADAKIKSDLAVYLRNNRLLDDLLVLFFAHMESERSATTASSVTKIEMIWPQQLEPHIDEDVAHDLLSSLTAMEYRKIVEALPALVRVWWNSLSNRSLKSVVEKYTTKIVSPLVIFRELSSILSWKGSTDEFSIKAASATNEVTAVYKKDEAELTIVLRIPAAYPLSPVAVDFTHKMGVQESTWRKWLLSMTTLLLTRDGTILDAVLLWKQFLDQHFNGVEPCTICYSIFHLSNHSLPNLPCRTCKNKFHSACLYKWFNTSHKNECPLCKTPFN